MDPSINLCINWSFSLEIIITIFFCPALSLSVSLSFLFHNTSCYRTYIVLSFSSLSTILSLSLATPLSLSLSLTLLQSFSFNLPYNLPLSHSLSMLRSFSASLLERAKDDSWFKIEWIILAYSCSSGKGKGTAWKNQNMTLKEHKSTFGAETLTGIFRQSIFLEA